MFAALRQSADANRSPRSSSLSREAPDRALCRINALAFAGPTWSRRGARHRRLPACGAARDLRPVVERAVPGLRRRARRQHDAEERAQRANTSARCAPPATSRRSTRWSRSPSRSARASAGSPRTIPDALPLLEYFRQIFWGSGVDLPGRSRASSSRRSRSRRSSCRPARRRISRCSCRRSS